MSNMSIILHVLSSKWLRRRMARDPLSCTRVVLAAEEVLHTAQVTLSDWIGVETGLKSSREPRKLLDLHHL